MNTLSKQPIPVKLFYSYSHRDKAHRAKLETHLATLKAQGIIADWYDRMIVAGTEWDEAIHTELEACDVILLLVSPDFLASEYCRGAEVSYALRRHEEKSGWVIPVILRPCDWQYEAFSKLQALPTDGKPITKWDNRDEAFLNVAQGIRRTVDQLKQRDIKGAELVLLRPDALQKTPMAALADTRKCQWEMVIEATFAELDQEKVQAILMVMRQVSGDAELKLRRIEAGSVRLVFEGSFLGYRQVEEMFSSGQLARVQEHVIRKVEFLAPLWWSDASHTTYSPRLRYRFDLSQWLNEYAMAQSESEIEILLDRLMDAMYPSIVLMMRSHMTRTEDAEDAAIEVSARLSQWLRKNQTRKEVLVNRAVVARVEWLGGVLLNANKRGSRSFSTGDIVPEPADLIAPSVEETALSNLEMATRANDIWQHLLSLSVRERVVFLLSLGPSEFQSLANRSVLSAALQEAGVSFDEIYEMLPLTNDEIASRLRIRSSQVAHYRSRARRSLQKFVTDSDANEC